MTNIRISQNTHAVLTDLKYKHNCKSIDDLIVHLITVHEKYESSEVVRLVRE